MSLRTIMIFPEFENVDVIDGIRKKYDPLAELVRPHITLVFPFDSRLSNAELEQILEKRLSGIKPFALELGSFSKQEDRFGNSLFLNVLQGTEELDRIHKLLYEGELKEFDLGFGYMPHVTVGKLPTVEQMEEAYAEVSTCQERFKTVVNTVSVEMIGENEESIIVIEKELG